MFIRRMLCQRQAAESEGVAGISVKVLSLVCFLDPRIGLFKTFILWGDGEGKRRGVENDFCYFASLSDSFWFVT